jgi:GNAT superfamily N-acetyltransferase
MAVHLYPVSPDHDSPGLADLISRVTGTSVSAERLRELDASAPAGSIRWQVVAVEDGRIVGYADTGRDASMEPGRFWLTIAVESERRGRGIGTMLLEDALSFAWEQGATTLALAAECTHPETAHFAVRHGFVATSPSGADEASSSRVYVLSLDGRGAVAEDQAELITLIRRLSQDLPDAADGTLICEAPCLVGCGGSSPADAKPDPSPDPSLWLRLLSLAQAE